MHISNDKSRYTESKLVLLDKMHEIHHLVRNDMDVNEHERLSNITHSSKETALSLLFCSRDFNNGHSSYHTMSVKRSLVCS